MKQLRIISLLLLIALGVLLYFRNTNDVDHSENAVHNFAVEDVSAVSRIFMVDKQGNRIDLKKKDDGNWILNDSFDAWKSRVESLLNETMSKVKVKGMVPKAARDNVLKRLIIAGVKVEIYNNNQSKPEMVYYVGGTTPDLLGTYYKLENEDDPYIVYIPGHNGYLTTRYTLKKDEWISRTVFGSTKNQIQKIVVDYPNDPKSSFTIEHDGDTIDLIRKVGESGKINSGAVRSYLNFFELRNFEGYVYNKSQNFIDSLKQTKPLVTISVQSANRGLDQLSIYPKPIDGRSKSLYDKQGNPLTVDADKYFAFYNKLDRLLTVQDYTFQKVILGYESFLVR